MVELKNCPFCGGVAKIHSCAELENETLNLLYSGKVGVHCTECHISTTPFNSEDEAAEVWNTRAGE